MKILLTCSWENENNFIFNNIQQNYEKFQSSLNVFNPTKEFFWWKAFAELGYEIQPYIYHNSTKFSSIDKLIGWLENRKFRGATITRQYIQRERRKLSGEQLINIIEINEPDILMLFQPDRIITPSLIRKIKQNFPITIILMIGTSPVALGRKNVRESSVYFDYVFCNDHYHAIQWRELGAKKVIPLPISACDPDFHFHIPALRHQKTTQHMTDISFIGRLLPLRIYRERIDFLDAIKDTNTGIWTDDIQAFDMFPQLRPMYKGSARGKKAVEVMSSSKISLNFHGHTMQSGGNMRTFEIPASRSMQIVDRYYSDWFAEGEEIVSFTNIQDLKEKINYYLRNDNKRDEISLEGQNRAYSDHTYKNRVSEIIKIIS